MTKKPFNKYQIRKRIAEIKRLVRRGLNGEIEAHELQDGLVQYALEDIAEKTTDPYAKGIASEVLKVYRVEFDKYYA